jgi:adenosylhomocysteinase
VREYTDEFLMRDGRRLYLLADGRLVNLSAAEGHPAVVMDMSFANQAFCVEHLVKGRASMPAGVYPVPVEIDRKIAALKLKTMRMPIDRLTKEQIRYLASWTEGT